LGTTLLKIQPVVVAFEALQMPLVAFVTIGEPFAS
jgi:hypothetical protein